MPRKYARHLDGARFGCVRVRVRVWVRVRVRVWVRVWVRLGIDALHLDGARFGRVGLGDGGRCLR